MTLPKGWVEAAIGEIAETKLGKMLDAAKNKGEPVQYLRNVNVRWGAFDLSDLLEMRVTAEEREALSVKDGDLFMCEGGEPGRCAVWRGGARDLVFQKAIHRVRPLDAVDPDYLATHVAYLAQQDGLSQLFTGTTIKHLPQVALQKIALPLPPAAEQRRIVAKLDALTARLTRARAELDRVPVLAKRVRQTALDDEFADPAFGEPVTLSDLGQWSSGGTPKSSEASFYGGDIPWLRSGDLPDGLIDRHVMTITDEGLHASPAKWVPAGAVLIAMYGATIGKLGVTTYPVTTNQAIACIVPSKRVTADWLFYLLLQKRPELVALGQGGAQPNISQQILKAIPTCLPVVEHQRAVSARLTSAIARADRMEAEAARARAMIDRLEAAILGRAFRGELVPQDPNDEPASVLLDRIRAQRAAAPKPKRGRRKKVEAQG